MNIPDNVFLAGIISVVFICLIHCLLYCFVVVLLMSSSTSTSFFSSSSCIRPHHCRYGKLCLFCHVV